MKILTTMLSVCALSATAGAQVPDYRAGARRPADVGLRRHQRPFRRGVGYLLRTQFSDGSWLVRSRTFPLQPLKDSGFPHGKNQWISAADTSWATMAIALALPPQTLSGTIP